MEAPANLEILELDRLVDESRRRLQENAYRSKNAINLQLGEKSGLWFSMKGGPPREKSIGGSLETFFNPTKNTWLKVAYQGQDGNSHRITLLRESVDIQRACLRLAKIPEVAEAIECYDLTLYKLPVFGFTQPHLGASLEYISKWIDQYFSRKQPMNPSIQKEIQREKVALFAKTYQIAYRQAKQLYI